MNTNISDFERELANVRNERLQAQGNSEAVNDSMIDEETALSIGLLRPENEEQPSETGFTDAEGIERDANGNRVYQKLSVGESWQDVGKAMGAEALKIFAPKAGSKMADILNYSEDDLWQYQAKTHLGENMQNLYKYGADTLAWGAAIALTGGAAAAVGGAAKLGTLVKVGNAIKKVGLGSDLVKTGANATKLAKAGAWTANKAIGGAAAGAIADYQLTEYGDTHLADILPQSKYLDFIQTRPTDTEFTTKLKAVTEGVILGFGVNATLGTALEPLLAKAFKGQHKLANAANETEAAEAMKELAENQVQIQKFTDTADLVEHIKALRDKSNETGEELSQLIIDNIPNEYRAEAQALGKTLSQGEDIFVHSDGTWDIKVETWQDAHKVSQTEYKKQLDAIDEQKAMNEPLTEVRKGDTAIQHQDQAVKETWTNRGWVGEGKSALINEKGVVNKSVANKIVKNYTDKLGIKNRVNIEVVEGLTVKGKKVAGYTDSAKTTGKVNKTLQNKIDKKQLQIRKLEDKITRAEGGNAEVMETLDVIKEELRIAKNELKELKATAKGTNVAKDITIRIDANAKNPYATLRAEIEHARDLAYGKVPDQNVKHFDRYDGLNEGEVASGYTYKKSVGRANAVKQTEEIVEDVPTNTSDEINITINEQEAKALDEVINTGEVKPETYEQLGLDFEAAARATDESTSQNVMNPLKDSENELKLNKETIDETRTNTTNTSRNTDREAIARRFVKEISEYNSSGSYGDGVFVRRNAVWIVDTAAEAIFDKAHISKTGYQELSQTTEAGESFVTALNKAKKNLKEKGEYVDVHTAEEYANARTFLSEDKLAGFAITKDGEIISVFADPSAKLIDFRGRGRAMIELAKQLGGNHLNCYDVGLPNYYKVHGFTETNRYKWDDDFWKPDKWHKELHKEYNNGEPDVIDMVLDNPKAQNINKINNTQSVEEVATNIAKGDVTINSVEEIETLLTKTIETDPEISGFKWENVANDADDYYNKLDVMDSLTAAEAFLSGDAKVLDQLARKQLAANKMLAKFYDLLDNAEGSNAYNILQAMDSLAKYSKAINSGAGRLLNYQKVVNKATDTFADSRLSDLARAGIVNIADILEKEINSNPLLFTRGDVLQFKNHIIQQLEKVDNGEFLNEILADDTMWKTFNDILDKSYKDKSFTASDFIKNVKEALTKEAVEDTSFLVKLCDKVENVKQVLLKGTGKVQGYMINNVLGLKSSLVNIVGGSLMSFHSANRRIIGGLLTRDGNITKAGIRQYQGLLENFSESLRLGKQAFLKGDGLLTTTKQYIDGAIQYNMEEWTGKTVQDWLSVIPRFMMASDEFMSQLNYRSMMRAKAIEMVERQLGDQVVDDKTFAELVAKKFEQIAFNKDGKPLDVYTFAEAKEILFQTPLNKKMWDYKKGRYEQVADKTFIGDVGAMVQMTVEQVPFLKFFMPFIKTPFNIADKAVQMNPFVQAFNGKTWERWNSKDPKIAAKTRGELAITIAMSLGAYLMAVNGGLTGSAPADRETAAALRKTGWQPYSFYIDGKFISYKMLAPFDTVLAAAADTASIHSSYTDEDEEKRIGFEEATQRAMAACMNDYFDQSGYRGNLEKVLDLLDPSLDGKRRQQLLGQTASGFLPFASTVRNVRTIGNSTQTEANSMWEAMVKNYLPVSSDFKRDVFGNRSDMFGMLITNVKDSDFEMPEYQAMAELAEVGWKPSQISLYVADSKIPLKEFKHPETGRSAYDYMQEELATIKLDGLTLREAVRNLVTTQDYQAMPIGVNKNGKDWDSIKEPTKIKEIKAIFKDYNDAAKEAVLMSEIPFTNAKGETMQDAKARVDNQMEQDTLNALINVF